MTCKIYELSAINSTFETYRSNGDKMKNKIKNSLLMFVTVVVGFLIICERKNVSQAVSEGLNICGNVIIPSLFPFMVLSTFALNTGVFDVENKAVSFVMKKVFHLPYISFSAIIFGFIGGYPVGARVIGELYEKGKISSSDAKHLMSFCVNAGPAFIVSAVGEMILHSKKAGYLILISCCVSSLITGVLYAKIKKVKDAVYQTDFSKKVAVSDAFVYSVGSSCKGIISICGWILVFSAFSGLVRVFIINEKAKLLFDSLSEITTGLSSAVELGGTVFVAACIAFGGICIAFQLLPYIKKCEMKITEYLRFRIINAVLTFFVSKIIMSFTSVTVNVYSKIQPEIHFAPASAALMIMCSILIFNMASVGKCDF